MKVLIIGGGIGGLAAALMLGARGISFEVFEQAPEIRELGVGINILPHAVKKLAGLGLLEQLSQVGVAAEELIYANRFGQTIWHELRGVRAGYDVPQFSIHRGRLQSVLRAAVEQRFGQVIRTGHRLASASQDAKTVTAVFETESGLVSETGTVLVGADGIHSATRSILLPELGPVSWNGILIWRGAADWPAFLGGKAVLISGGMREKAVVYPIAEGANPGTCLTNWSINVKIGDSTTPLPVKEDWTRPGRRDELMKHVARFRVPFVDIKGLVEASEQFWEYPMCDRDPLPYWSHGRITLLGDAAHPMYPTGSNGAGQAILDADWLVQCLDSAPSVIDALRAYEATRLPATAAVVAQNRSGGPERVIDVVEDSAPEGFDSIDAVLSFEERRTIVEQYASMAGFTQMQVNG